MSAPIHPNNVKSCPSEPKYRRMETRLKIKKMVLLAPLLLLHKPHDRYHHSSEHAEAQPDDVEPHESDSSQWSKADKGSLRGSSISIGTFFHKAKHVTNTANEIAF